MSSEIVITGLAGILAASAPVVLAVIGETITERAGVINLSLNGLSLLSAMAGFAVAHATQNVLAGFVSGAAVGALVGALVAFSSITLRQSQVAIGFVLSLLCRDLAYFLGNPFVGLTSPVVPACPLPLLNKIPFLGRVFFSQDWVTYSSYLAIGLAWFWIFKTRPGLALQGVGERPAAAYVRGVRVNRLRAFYTILGSAIVGLAGPAYSLCMKAGWRGSISGLDGIGWIALAITIFGGWNPLRAAFGAYLFGFLQWLGVILQSSLPGIPTQVFQVAPFPLMILTLLLVNAADGDWATNRLAGVPEQARSWFIRLFQKLRAAPPAALGTPFERP